MKELSFEKMENIEGGSLVSMFCNAAGAASLATGIAIEVGLAASLGPLGFAIIGGISAGCLISQW